MSILYNYITEGLFTKINSAESIIKVKNNKLQKIYIYNNNSKDQTSETGNTYFLNIYKNNINDFNFITKDNKTILTTNTTSLLSKNVTFYPTKEKINNINKILNNWEINEFHGPSNKNINIKIIFDYWNSIGSLKTSQASNIDLTDSKYSNKIIPYIYKNINIILFDVVFQKTSIINGLNITSDGSVIFNFYAIRYGWYFKTTTIIANDIIICEYNTYHISAAKKQNPTYCMGHLPNKILDYYAGFNPIGENLYFILGCIYKNNIFLYKNENIITNTTTITQGSLYYNGLTNIDNYLLEAAVSWLIPSAIGYMTKKYLINTEYATHTYMPIKKYIDICTLDDLYNYIPNVGLNHKALDFYKKFVTQFKKIQNVIFIFKRESYTKTYILLKYNTISNKITLYLADNKNVILNYLNLNYEKIRELIN